MSTSKTMTPGASKKKAGKKKASKKTQTKPDHRRRAEPALRGRHRFPSDSEALPRENGRPTSFHPFFAHQARKLCTMGAIEVDLAELFGVTVDTINQWKQRHRNFAEAVMDGKDTWDDEVQRAVHHAAVGYSHPEEKVFCVKDDEGKHRIITHTITKHYPPNMSGAMFWLVNRQRAKYARQPPPAFENPAESDPIQARVDPQKILARASQRILEGEFTQKIEPEPPIQKVNPPQIPAIVPPPVPGRLK